MAFDSPGVRYCAAMTTVPVAEMLRCLNHHHPRSRAEGSGLVHATVSEAANKGGVQRSTDHSTCTCPCTCKSICVCIHIRIRTGPLDKLRDKLAEGSP